ncbi:MAG TPA: GNAT family N-acetyltransferase [Gaiellaceae bacterium]
MIAFQPLQREHLPLLAGWLAREHVRRWWRDPVELALAKRVEGIEQDRTEQYLIVSEERPVGMIQTYLVADSPEWEAIVGAEPGLAGVDLLIGEEDAAGRGLGPQVLEQFTREVVFARAETSACVATVEEANRRSWRAFEKAGFRHVRDVEEDGLPHRLMRLERRYAP